MPIPDFYELLGIDPTASADVVKQAFRQQIARYHPDKVQHLGQEFQALAAERAAELTQAYAVLSEATRRAEYDRTRRGTASAAAPQAEQAKTPSPPKAASTAPEPAPPPAAAPAPSPRFEEERNVRDEFVRLATLGQFQKVLASSVPQLYEESKVVGFDLAWVPKKPRLFSRAKNPRILVQYLPHVDGAAVIDAWERATQWPGAALEVCVFLIGSTLASSNDLAGAIASQREKGRANHVTVVPMDATTWHAHVPTDAPTLAKTVAAGLRQRGRY